MPTPLLPRTILQAKVINCRLVATYTPCTVYSIARHRGIATDRQICNTSYSFPNSLRRTRIEQRRTMSTPADHKPLKNPPKEPPIPRPSSRQVSFPATYDMLTTPVYFSFRQQTRSFFSAAYARPLPSPQHTSSPAVRSPPNTTVKYRA